MRWSKSLLSGILPGILMLVLSMPACNDGDDDDTSTNPSSSPSPHEGEDTSPTPEATATPAVTMPPDTTPSPAPTEPPEATPGPTTPLDSTGTPAPTEPPEPTGTPGTTEPPEDTATPGPTATPGSGTDADGDGVSVEADDCDDGDPSVYPGALELCDGKDNDCGGDVDEEATTFYADMDQDGYGDAGDAATGCTAPDGYVSTSDDCDDTDADINPDAIEACDGLDNDCDDQVDDEVSLTFYTDIDGDGHGDADAPVEACTQPAGTSTTPDDCDDADASAFPGNAESCDDHDNDCDAQIDEGVQSTFYQDGDTDGAGNAAASIQACSAPEGYVSNSKDCNDSDAEVYIGADEVCDGKDNDCDSQIDENGATTFYRDFDLDNYGDETVTYFGCYAPGGYVSNADDCNDKDATVHPNALESCNSRDDDCDGQVDEGVTTAWYLDADKDGYGTDDSVIEACSSPSSSYSAQGGDCNDLNAAVHPAAAEACNGVDDDCDTSIDDGVQSTFYEDGDGDGYGGDDVMTQACAAPEGYVADATDCDDTEPTTHPDADELCDGIDNDCDKSVDEEVKVTFYLDNDGDGYGISTATIQACSAPTGYAALSGDCNDSAADVNPGAAELCDSRDNDCDSQIDEGAKTAWYYDGDKDSHGVASSEIEACTAPSSSYVTLGDDCNDADASIYPGATETCNGADDDCDGQLDETGDNVYYVDGDGDGYGSSAESTTSCSTPSGYADNATDCDDSDATVYPSATEVRGDDIDQDCSGEDLPHIDLNLDGWPDIVVANQYSAVSGGYAQDSYIYWGSSKGPSSNNKTSLPTLGAFRACVADFDQDGYQDVAFANYRDNSTTQVTSYVYWGREGGPISSDRTELPTLGATDCGMGDLNGDGWTDLVFSGYYSTPNASYSAKTYVYYGAPERFTTDSSSELASSGNYALTIADVNDDGFDDLIQANHYTTSTGYLQTSYLYWGSSDGVSVDHRQGFSTVGCWHSPVVADLDGDGYKDILFSSYYNNSTYDVSSYIYWNSSSGFTGTKTDLPSQGGSEAYVGDLDADGYLDIVIGSYYNQSYGYSTQSSVYWGTSRGYSTADRTLLTSYGVYDLKVADVNQDGYDDLTFAFYYSGSYTLNSYTYYGTPSGYSTSSVAALPTNGAISVDVMDVDLDGWDDILYAGYYNGSSYNTDGYLYWGSSKGFGSDVRVTLPMLGGRRVKIIGDPE